MKKNLRTVTGLYFLTTLNEVEKYVELIEKVSEAKIMIQSSSSDNCVRIHNIEISNLFDLELQLTDTKP